MALENWLKVAGIQSGQIFRRVGQHGNVGDSLDKDSIGRIVKRLVRRAKLANPNIAAAGAIQALDAGTGRQASPLNGTRLRPN